MGRKPWHLGLGCRLQLRGAAVKEFLILAFGSFWFWIFWSFVFWFHFQIFNLNFFESWICVFKLYVLCWGSAYCDGSSQWESFTLGQDQVFVHSKMHIYMVALSGLSLKLVSPLLSKYGGVSHWSCTFGILFDSWKSHCSHIDFDWFLRFVCDTYLNFHHVSSRWQKLINLSILS